MLDISVNQALQSGIVKHGDTVVITAGVPVGKAGTTNIMKVHSVGNSLVKGQGIGRKHAVGKIVIAKIRQEALEKVTEGSILVTYMTDRDMVPAIEKCSAIVTVEGGLTSHAAVVGLNLGLPVVVGVKDAFEIFSEGQVVTVDASTGLIYEGRNRVL